MKKMIFLGWLIVFIPAMLFGQEKVEAPVWNVGDKWVFTQGNIEVVGVDQNGYTLKFSKDICVYQNVNFEKIIFEKSTLNRIQTLKGSKQEKYTERNRRILNFPLNPGKQWEDTFSGIALGGVHAGGFATYTFRYAETFAVLGWEDVEVRAGKFKTVKLEYKLKNITPGGFWYGWEGWIRYWFSPDVKYFVKCQYDKLNYTGVQDWELASFKLIK